MDYSRNQICETEQALMLVARAGEILVKSGAEIFRVETTMEHMANALHVESLKTYVIANGIFLTSGGIHEPLHAHISRVHTGDAHLGKIEALNELSREMQVLAAGVGTVCFSALFRVPVKHFPTCLSIGASAWLVYLLVEEQCNRSLLAILVSFS